MVIEHHSLLLVEEFGDSLHGFLIGVILLCLFGDLLHEDIVDGIVKEVDLLILNEFLEVV